MASAHSNSVFKVVFVANYRNTDRIDLLICPAFSGQTLPNDDCEIKQNVATGNNVAIAIVGEFLGITYRYQSKTLL